MPIKLNNFPDWRPYSNVQPFTVRDGATYLLQLEALKDWLRDYVIPHINTEISGLAETWVNQVTILIENWERLSEELIQQVGEVASGVEADAAAAQAAKLAAEAARDLAQQFASQAQEIQDSAISVILNDTDSSTRQLLDNLYASQAELTDLATILDGYATRLEGVETAVNETLPSRISDIETQLDGYVKTAELDAETAERVNDVDSETRAAIESLITHSAETFSFDVAEAQYGLRVYGQSTTRVMQSISVTDKPVGYIATSYALAGTTGARETTLVTLHSAAGKSMGEMVFTDAGHGTGVFLEVTDSGQMFIWLSYTNHSIGSGVGRYIYVRVPWSAGTTHTFATASPYKVNALSRAGYLTAHVDERNGIVGVREDNGQGTGATFTVHTMPNLLSGTWNPMFTMNYNYPANTVVQGWAYLDGYWYIYSGNRSDDPAYLPVEILQIDAQTGVLRLRRNFDEIRNGFTGDDFYGFSEPEGISIARGFGGDPSIIVGMSSGPQGGRNNALWFIGAGFNPFRAAGMAHDWAAGGTDWSAYPLTPAAGITLGTGTQAFGVRRTGEYVEFRGTLNGAFPGGSTDLGQLLPGFYSPTRHVRGVAAKSSVTASPSSNARIDLNVTGGLSVSCDLGASGNASWIDLTGFRAPIL